MPELLIDRPGEPRRRYRLDRDALILGRSATCDIVLEGGFVSREHARLERRGDSYDLVDTDSLNGVQVNGKKLQIGKPHRLATQDEFTVGEFVLTYWVETDEESTLQQEGPAPGVLYVNVPARAVWVGDRKVERELTHFEFRLLSFLYDRRGTVCTKAEIGEHVWGAPAGEGSPAQYDDTALQQLIHRLRQKLKDDAASGYIVNVRGEGYRLDDRLA